MSSYYNQFNQPMSAKAFHALRAAQLWPNIGRWAAMRYAQKNNVPFSLVRLARQLWATRNIN